MPLKPRNLKKLASLSAVGAGALALTADKAEAGIITNYVPLNQTVGFAPTDLASGGASFTFSGRPFKFSFQRQFGASYSGYAVYRAIVGVGANTFRSGNSVFATSNGLRFGLAGAPVLKIVPAGQTWNTAIGKTSSGYPIAVMGVRVWGSGSTGSSSSAGFHSGFTTFHHTFGNSSFQHQYALFQFSPFGTPLYGWIQLSYTVNDAWGPACGPGPACGDPGNSGPELTIEGFAYETAASDPVPLAAGYATPEPGTFAATGLAALALGAVGMRRWRAARKG